MARLTENLNLQRALLRRLEIDKEVRLIDNTRVDMIYREDREGEGWPIVRLADGQQFRARLLVSPFAI
jgi:ubiquinone biosynthesis monooxygenase Coq6